ncbi:heavy metal-associated domain-containing protein [Streptomyces sp. NPDC051976]|uniref:heavy-metal-associated domain-containing protein n=1 Tax=Streptomyces sp. NPDC051976 TaxID=3154947 RepID=UPI003443AE65
MLITHAMRLKDLHCVDCADTVVEVLESLAGVEYVEIALADNTAEVTCRETITHQDLRAWLSDIGFRPETLEDR